MASRRKSVNESIATHCLSIVIEEYRLWRLVIWSFLLNEHEAKIWLFKDFWIQAPISSALSQLTVLFSSINPEFSYTSFSGLVNGLWLQNHVRISKKSWVSLSTRAEPNSLCCELELPSGINSSIALLTLKQNNNYTFF